MNEATIEELRTFFRLDDTQVGSTFRLMEEGITRASELVERGTAANSGVISHHKAIIKAIIDGELPKNSAYIANYARRTIDRFIDTFPDMSDEAKKLLLTRRLGLLEIIGNKEAIQNDTKILVSESAKLEGSLQEFKDAIYVYTFPTYYRAGVDGDPDVRWLKIGLTSSNIWQRIVDQNRQTSMPEDPVVIRVYHKEGIDLKETEKKIQSSLKRVRHNQSSARYTRSGTEWFATTEDSIDAIAELLGLEVIKFDFN